MTPQFTTPCFVRIEDKDKRKEICEKLERMGYKSTLAAEYNSWGNLIVVRRYGVIQNTGIEYGELPTYLIDCSTNTDLFLALAGMREDTDLGQWFVSIYGDWLQSKAADFWDSAECGFVENWNKATVAEIINHFKNHN